MNTDGVPDLGRFCFLVVVVWGFFLNKGQSCIILPMDRETSFIFDLDGTLWDARVEVAEAWKEAAISEFGTTHIDVDLVASLMGKPMRDIALAIAPSFLGEEDKLAFGVRAFAHENRYLSSHPGHLFPDVVETLTELKRRGHGIYLVSNCQNGYIETFLPVALPFRFDGYLCYGDTGKEKHYTIRLLMEKYGIGKAVYVGDTLGDEKETHLAGLPFVYASYGFGESTSHEYKIDRFADLLTL